MTSYETIKQMLAEKNLRMMDVQKALGQSSSVSTTRMVQRDIRLGNYLKIAHYLGYKVYVSDGNTAYEVESTEYSPKKRETGAEKTAEK